MKRDSEPARKVVEALANLGIESSGRQLERYSQNGLLPPGTPSAEQIAQHIAGAAIAETYRPGLVGAADKAVLAAAGLGYGCAGLPAALDRVWGSPVCVEHEPLDPWDDEGNRAIGVEVTDMMAFIRDGAPEVPPLLTKFLQVMVGTAKQSYEEVPITDPVTETAEAPIQSLSSAWELALGMTYGTGPPTEPESIAAVAGLGAIDGVEGEQLDDNDLDAMAEVAEDFPTVRVQTIEALTASIEVLVAGAVWWRRRFSAPGFVSRFDAEELNQLAGMLAPIGVAFSQIEPLPPT